MSETRKSAKALVETRTEVVESHHPLQESQERLEAALGKAPPLRLHYHTNWTEQEGRVVLRLELLPSPGVRRMLKATSLVLAVLVVLSAWLLFARGEGALRFLVPLSTLLAVLSLPFVVTGLASQRDAEIARLLRIARVALQDLSPDFPKAQKWEDEE